MTYNNDIWSIDNDLIFCNDMITKGLKVSETDKSVFRFYHMKGPHSPYRPDEGA